MLLLGRVRHRQAPLHLAHAVGAAFWRLGRPRCAEDESVAGPQQYTATASLCNTSGTLAKIARILGKTEDAAKYKELSRKVADAYCSVLTDGNGKTKEEFQTAYVLPLYLNMFPEIKAKLPRIWSSWLRRATTRSAQASRARRTSCLRWPTTATPTLLQDAAEHTVSQLAV